MISPLRKTIRSVSKLGELVFFPSSCQICSALLESPEDNVVCRACWNKIIVRHRSYCLCCGRFFSGEGEPHLCQNCLEVKPPFKIHRSCGKYEGGLKDILLLYKYRLYRVLGKRLGEHACQVLKNDEDLWWKVEIIMPVPLHPKRERQRGFNQSRIIARELGKLKGIDVAEKILIRIKNVPPQTLLEAEEREKNVAGAFRVVTNERIEGKIVLLVDDVYTTGATIRECCRMLNEAGVKEVRALTLAQA